MSFDGFPFCELGDPRCLTLFPLLLPTPLSTSITFPLLSPSLSSPSLHFPAAFFFFVSCTFIYNSFNYFFYFFVMIASLRAKTINWSGEAKKASIDKFSFFFFSNVSIDTKSIIVFRFQKFCFIFIYLCLRSFETHTRLLLLDEWRNVWLPPSFFLFFIGIKGKWFFFFINWIISLIHTFLKSLLLFSFKYYFFSTVLIDRST